MISLQEFNELRNHLDDGCEVLQQVLVSDVPGPQVKLNVGQLEASKRKDIGKVIFQFKISPLEGDHLKVS